METIVKSNIKYFTKNIISLIGVLILLFTSSLLAQNKKTNLRILDINIWSGLDYVGRLKMGEYETPDIREKRYQALVTQIKELDPDIIGIHEANLLPRYAKRLVKDIGYIPFYHIGVGGIHIGPLGLPSNLREGDVILAKEELSPLWIGREKLSGGYVSKYVTFHFEDATQVIGVRIFIESNPINIYATHWHSSILPSKEVIERADKILSNGKTIQAEYDSLFRMIHAGIEWRIDESDKTIKFINTTAGDQPVVLMGDFNSINQSEEIQNLENFGLVDTYKYLNPDSLGYTWEPSTNINQQIHYLADDSTSLKNIFDEIEFLDKQLPKRIDCIFVGSRSLVLSGKIIVTDSKVVMKQIINDVQTSDHFGIFSELEFNF